MPIVSALGAMSSRGFGEFAQSSTSAKYIEDYFSAYLYTGVSSGSSPTQNIPNGVSLSDTASWSVVKNQNGQTQSYSTAVDSAGNYYSLGYDTSGTLSFIIIKYSSTGSVLWQRNLKQNGSVGYAIAVDASDNVFVVGYASDGSTNYALLAKYNSSGTLQWARRFNQNNTIGRGVAVDTTGNIYITGNANDGSFNYIFLVKYDTSGNIQWQKKILQNGSLGYSVATDSSNNVLVAGYANDGSSNYMAFIKFDSSGTLLLRRRLYEGNSLARGIATDSAGNFYVVGYADSGTQNYILAAKYDSSGVIQWQRKITFFSNNSFGTNVSVDSSNNVYFTGYAINGTNYLGFVLKYDSSGTLQWQRQLTNILSSQEDTYAWGLTAKSSSDLFVAGTCSSNSGLDLFGYTAKLKSDGTTVSGYATLILSPGNLTSATGAATDATGSSMAVSNGSGTDAAASVTDSAGSSTVTLATQPAVTGAGGLLWIKGRNNGTSTTGHVLADTERGRGSYLRSQATSAAATSPAGYDIDNFLANGFALGTPNNFNLMSSSVNYATWTWRETPKFFDVVTYTGNGVARTISHNLGSVPGMIIVKRTDDVGTWWVYHRSLGNTQYLVLNATDPAATFNLWNNTTPTDTVFSISGSAQVNAGGGTYIAYLFAHNAGGFGLDGTQNVISCGSFTADGSGNASINLGYEPQFILTKRTDGSTGGLANWVIVDTMRGLGADAFSGGTLNANDSTAEIAGNSYPRITSTGFNITTSASQSFIYMAIRRGPMKVPTDATTVFSPSIYTGTVTSANPNNRMLPATDVWFNSARNASGNTYVIDRLRGWNYLYTPSTAAEDTSYTWSQTNQTTLGPVSPTNWWGSSTSQVDYYFKRAPGFMDEVCYTGTGVATTQAHNLGVAPELMIFKSRNTASTNWAVISQITSTTYTYGVMQLSNTMTTGRTYGPGGSPNFEELSAAPTASVINLASSAELNASGRTFVAYLFASCPGVSKVGSYTGTGATQNISCGFTGGARYVMIKRVDGTGNWWFWDTARGMVAGTDPRSAYNSSGAETNANWVYTTTGGFQIVTSDATVNASGGTYIYLAIA